MFLPRKILEEKLLHILAEDVGQGDTTTALIISPESTTEAEVVAEEAGIIAGIEEAETLLQSQKLQVETLTPDGEKVKSGQTLMRISGNARTILATERTLLNILSRMSGIATATRRIVERIRKARLKTRVAATRKTAPGLLYFDKKAVLIGGGDTHRSHLDDMVLIKDNHIALAGGVEKAVKKAREAVSFSKKVEVEVSSAEDALIAAKAGADVVMLDNFTPKQAERAMKLLNESKLLERVLVEASGGITEENVLEFASKHLDIVSLGEITDSPKALDISLQLTGIREREKRR